jgi:hypothetical protein
MLSLLGFNFQNGRVKEVVNSEKGFVLVGDKGNFNVSFLSSNFRWFYLAHFILFFISSPSDILFRDCVARFLFSFVSFFPPRRAYEMHSKVFRLKRET